MRSGNIFGKKSLQVIILFAVAPAAAACAMGMDEITTTLEVCGDGIDNDGDGNTDCWDPDCGFQGAVEMSCADGMDNDCDGNTDVWDSDCPESTEICDDGMDNDGDGDMDCWDADCGFQGPSELSCGDGIDNDCDGNTDEWDSDCAGEDPPPPSTEICGDGIDNDGDGNADCWDTDCGYEGSNEASCADGVDNDCDGNTDEWDSDCAPDDPPPPSTEICGDGVDNDGDGNADCWDTDCGYEGSSETTCDDGLDNDCDGDVDDEDGDCAVTTPDECTDLSPLTCEGGASYCGELIQFDPTTGPGYIDYPANGETWENQYRSWLRRDVVMLIKYATAKVACLAEGWDYGSGNGRPLGFLDMSERNGAIPGTSVGSPGHPEGTHTNGFDIDVAYYQDGTSDNQGRPICEHTTGGSEAYHCTATPHLLDEYRTALFLGALFEHPYVRVVGVDGRAALMIEEAFHGLCADGLITSYACSRRSTKLAYETTDSGRGWYYFHHHHMHISFSGPTYAPPPASAYGELECLVTGCVDAPLVNYLDRFDLPMH